MNHYFASSVSDSFLLYFQVLQRHHPADGGHPRRPTGHLADGGHLRDQLCLHPGGGVAGGASRPQEADPGKPLRYVVGTPLRLIGLKLNALKEKAKHDIRVAPQ